MTDNHLISEIQSTDNIIEHFNQFRQWEDRYRFIMKIGKNLQAMPVNTQNESNEVSGCESKVWLTHTKHDNQLTFFATSDSRIVKGLLWIILTPINHMDNAEIAQFDFDTYFEQLNLIKHLSPSRGAGLLAITQKIKQICQQ
ncbi:SufE family protein [Algibacillus agarilyticus]|uniref:SufE family protein n=1 Tax=Algibacillus agarilyticus TaxID=2234133 RepID=UPI000DCFBACC|nr:SufE family protein [Algibacillus agarilyticus]